MRIVYTLAVYLLLPILFGYFLWRSRREPDYQRGWLQRLGFAPRQQGPCLWLHAASVGETQAALPLIERLLARYPDHRIVVSNFTPTGAALIRSRLGDQVDQVLLPVDTPCAVRRFLKRVRPRAGVIIETELWPNLLLACKARSIPLVLASATLSEKSARRYRRFPGRRLMHRTLQAFHVVAVQGGADAQRFAGLGVHSGRIETSGNLKFDLAVDTKLISQAATLRHEWHATARPVWLAASTHEGEESIAIEAFRALEAQYPDQLLVLVPRHPQRFDEVAALLAKSGLRHVRRSQGQVVGPDTQILLADTLGELMLFYALADVAFVGGSLVPIGGHNLLEPAALGKPIITGPYCESQQQLLDLLKQRDAIRELQEAADLAPSLEKLLADATRRQSMGLAGRDVVTQNRGALSRVEGAITRSLLQARSP